MADKNDVKKALERCPSYGMCDDEDCPYYHTVGCLEALRKDALELLKEKQPMLIDANQIKQLADGTDVWLEAKDGEVFALTSKRPWVGFYIDRIENGTYRCWTARPTDEQRKSVPWADT